MTAFLQCFLIFTQIGFALFWNLASSFGEVYDPFCTVFLGASFHIFQTFQNLEPGFQIFQIPDPRNRLLGLGTLLHVFVGQQNCRFVYRMENVPQTLSDTLYKFFL